MEPGLKTAIVSILESVPDMTIATVRDDGWPQATTVSFVSDGLTIYFGTGAQAQKARNIARNDKVSVTVNRPYRSWNEIKGLSLGGTARRLSDPAEMQRVGQMMFAKFPEIGNYIAADAGELALFKISPSVIALLDYGKGFGHTEYTNL